MQIALWHFDQVLSSLRVRLSCEVPLTLFSLFFFFYLATPSLSIKPGDNNGQSRGTRKPALLIRKDTYRGQEGSRSSVSGECDFYFAGKQALPVQIKFIAHFIFFDVRLLTKLFRGGLR